MDLLDINIWVALSDPDHPHHLRARTYWEAERDSQVVFCRITMLGLVRLLTNPKVVKSGPFTPVEAWACYREFLGLPDVGFIYETGGLDNYMAAWAKDPGIPHAMWNDAFLAALAMQANCRLVSFDGDFARFPALKFLHLKI